MMTTVGFVIGLALSAIGGAWFVRELYLARGRVLARAQRAAVRAELWEAELAERPTTPLPPVPVPRHRLGLAVDYPPVHGRSSAGRVAGLAGSIGGA